MTHEAFERIGVEDEILKKTATAWCNAHGIDHERLARKWRDMRVFMCRYHHELSEEDALRAAVRYIVSEENDRIRRETPHETKTIKVVYGGLERTLTYASYNRLTTIKNI